MNRQHLTDYARLGAQSRLAVLDQERDEIFKMFPELRDGAGRDGAAPKARKNRLSPEARKAVSERMRAYWAERRATKSAGAHGTARKSSAKKSAPKAKRTSGMSAEARKAQGERMKAYWAAKRAEKQAALGEGTQVEAATNSASLSKSSGRRAGRKQGRKK